jgi:protein deglycase
MRRALVILADGFEETEAVTTIDLLRRGGVEVMVAALTGESARGSHGIAVAADATLDDARGVDYDLVALPGGQPGATNLAADARVLKLVAAHARDGRLVAAICAAPAVLAAAGVLDGRRATAFPGALAHDAAPGLTLTGDAVVRDAHVITSRGPGTAIDFALALVEALEGRAVRDEVEAALQR